MTHRYFSESPIVGNRALLAGREAHHLIHVMRAKPGDGVVLFDGSGAEFPARVERVGRSEVELAVLSRQEVDRELPFKLTLAASLPKGDRQKWLVEKAVELGVSRLLPLLTERSVARVAKQAIPRLRRTAIEASKQCGRNRLMEIAGPQRWSDFAASARGTACRLLAHPGSQTAQTPHSPPGGGLQEVGRAQAVILAVGPEGGFTADEVALGGAAGWRLVGLGPRILRTETAAILLVAMVVQSRHET